MKNVLLSILLCMFTVSANSAVRFNPIYNMWEGNICMNSSRWQIVNYQPLGSICWMNVPGIGRMQGIIINN